jgi:hypothetical protein
MRPDPGARTTAPPARPVRAVTHRRARLAAAAVAVVGSGLLVTRVGHGPVAGAVGDGLFAGLVYLLVALVAPRARVVVVGAIACGLCVVIELLQLTGIPAAATQVWGPARYVLGTTFQAVDLVAYAVGAAVGAAADRAVSGDLRGGGPDEGSAEVSGGGPAHR